MAAWSLAGRRCVEPWLTGMQVPRIGCSGSIPALEDCLYGVCQRRVRLQHLIQRQLSHRTHCTQDERNDSISSI